MRCISLRDAAVDLGRRPKGAMAMDRFSISTKSVRGHAPPLKEETAINKGPILLILCLFNPTVKGTWIDQKVQKKLGPLRKTA